jgi:hypothetical protein
MTASDVWIKVWKKTCQIILLLVFLKKSQCITGPKVVLL